MINWIIQTLFGLMNLCMYKGSPATLPHSMNLLFFLLLIELIVNALGWKSLSNSSWFEVMSATILYLILFMSLIYFLLRNKKYSERWVKVIIGFFGVELLLMALSQVIILIIPPLVLFIKIWKLFVWGFILKQALDIKLSSAVLITLAFYVISTLPISFILGEQIQAHIQTRLQLQ